jgi:Rhomboid family
VSAGSPDLFVVCKNCHAEVSPYITECPYCGNRLRKRAPKIDRNGQVNEKRRRRSPGPSLSRLKPNEIPGIRGDSHPYAALALVVLGFAGTMLYRAEALGSTHALLLWAQFGTHMWWRLIERRHGPIVVIVLYAIGAVGGTAAAIALSTHAYVLGANGAALAFIAAWAVPDLLDLRAGEDVEGDLIGAGVIAAAVALMPLIGADASWIADAVGALAGLLVGLGLTRVSAG